MLPDGVKAGCVIGKKGIVMENICERNPGVEIRTVAEGTAGVSGFSLHDIGGGEESLVSATLTLQAVVNHEAMVQARSGWRWRVFSKTEPHH
jgi:hypothetical protein